MIIHNNRLTSSDSTPTVSSKHKIDLRPAMRLADVTRLSRYAVRMAPTASHFESHSLDLEGETTSLRVEVRRWLWRLLLGTVLLVPLAWVVNASAWPATLVASLGLLLATPVYLAIGWPLIRTGLRHSSQRGDLLLAVGVTLAFAWALWQFSQFFRLVSEGKTTPGIDVQGSHFLDASLMLTFIALGKYLLAVALERTSAPLRDLIELPPENAICVREGRQVAVATSEVGVGETILIRPGQRVPLDARVLSGTSQIDQAWLTGDPRAADCGPDAEIFAGTLNVAGPLIARVVHDLGDSTPQRIVALLSRPGAKQSVLERRIARLAAGFVLVVLLAAAATCGAWLMGGTRHDALQATIAVLLSASASSLAYSARSALKVGCGRGAQQGVLLTSGAAAEAATLLTNVALDKAAAITPGLPAVVELITYDRVRGDELLATAAAAAQFGGDPLSICILAEARRRGLRIPGTRGHTIASGQGLSARTLTGETFVGLDSWLTTLDVDVSPLTGKLSAIRSAGQSAYVVSVGTRLFGAVTAADVVAPYSRQAVGQLRALGMRVVLISADSPAITAAAAREVTFDQVISGVSPSNKSEIIAQLRKPGGRVALVGARTEDKASLAAADLGIALDVQGEVTSAGAEIILPGDLRGVARAILLSRAIFGAIRTNLGFAVAYNVLLIPLAAVGLLPCVLAAAATAVASVAVVANSLLLLRRRID